MKVTCPACDSAIPSADVDLKSGWGKCARCDEVFPLADVLPDYRPAGNQHHAPAERPFDAWARLASASDFLAIYLPPKGMRAAAWAMLAFATFWLAFIAFWTAGALGVFFGANGQQAQPANIMFACFSIPFWLVGFGMLGGVLWMSRGNYTVYVDNTHLLAEKKCGPFRRRRVIDRAQVQHARESTKTLRSENQAPEPTVEIVFEKGSFALPCETDAERGWLVAEINRFLESNPPSGEMFGGWPDAIAQQRIRDLKRGGEHPETRDGMRNGHRNRRSF